MTSDADWEARQLYWRRKLGRLRLGAEPIEEQLERYRRVTVVLTVIAAALALVFVSLFTAFGRPDVGAVVAFVLFAPVVATAWVDHALLRRRAAGYLAELREYERSRGVRTPGGVEVHPPAS
jgi:hypothetical protein